jgi:zinc protease
VQTHTLSNGLRVLLVEKPSVPVVAVQVWYRAGSVNEKDGIRGIAHLFEHMMFRGSKNFGPEEHSRRIHDVGGSCNAYTGEHVTVYIESLPAEHLDLALRLEADRMASLRLNQDVLHTEREVILEEFHRYLNHPFSRAFLEFRKRLFTVHPYHWTPLGELADIERISLDDCQTFYRTHYAPNNAMVLLVGDIRPGAALAAVERHFGSLRPADVAPASYPAEPLQPQSQRFSMELPIEVPVLSVTYRTPEASHPDVPALAVLDQVLANGRSARLEEHVVKQNRIAVYAGGMLFVSRDPGLYACFAAYLPGRRETTVVKAILDQIDRIRDQGVTRDELESARNRLVGSKVFDLFSAEAIASEVGHAEFIEGDYRRFENLEERYEKVTLEDVRRVARQHLVPDRMTVLSVRPDRFRPLYWLGGLFYSLWR